MLQRVTDGCLLHAYHWALYDSPLKPIRPNETLIVRDLDCMPRFLTGSLLLNCDTHFVVVIAFAWKMFRPLIGGPTTRRCKNVLLFKATPTIVGEAFIFYL